MTRQTFGTFKMLDETLDGNGDVRLRMNTGSRFEWVNVPVSDLLKKVDFSDGEESGLWDPWWLLEFVWDTTIFLIMAAVCLVCIVFTLVQLYRSITRFGVYLIDTFGVAEASVRPLHRAKRLY